MVPVSAHISLFQPLDKPWLQVLELYQHNKNIHMNFKTQQHKVYISINLEIFKLI
jgi:hypothetical protein